jgi:hypothetical protein
MAKAPIDIARATPHPQTFRRTLSEDRTQIESTCETCGEALSGTVRNGLPKREIQHFISCSKAARNNPAKIA